MPLSKLTHLTPLRPVEDAASPNDPFLTWQAHSGGSLSQFVVWNYLFIKRGLQPGKDFLYQTTLGNKSNPQYVFDFYFPNKREAWVIEGFKYGLQSGQMLVGKLMAKGQGHHVITLQEDDLFSEDSEKALDLAWYNGQEVTNRALS